MTKATALILAGQRAGQIDPLAAAAGVALKCLVPVAGRPMILHVLDTLIASPDVGRIIVSVNDPNALHALAPAHRLVAAGRVRIIPARANLADSVIDALADIAWPALVTTADNVLLTPAAVAEFIGHAVKADVAAAFARRGDVLAAHPAAQRRFYRFACDAYSNCNLYWIGSADALAPVEIFRGGGQFAKHPARIVRAFGLLNLLRFRLGLGTLAGAFGRFSRRYGRRLESVILSDGAVAIDVDNARTRAIAETLLARRRA